jgi:thiol-disulfide isomerase/thioredoxin
MLSLLLFGCIPELTSPRGVADDGTYTPPDNAWPFAESLPPLEGEGYGVGEVVERQFLPDQNGQTVDLWQFYGLVWVLDVSTIWCQPCQDLASELQATADDYADEGFVYVSILAEDLEGSVPDTADLQYWAESWGIEDQPIVSDDQGFTGVLTKGQYPLVLVVGRDLKVASKVSVPDDAQVREAIEAAL